MKRNLVIRLRPSKWCVFYRRI